jgi:hypothetical protein
VRISVKIFGLNDRRSKLYSEHLFGVRSNLKNLMMTNKKKCELYNDDNDYDDNDEGDDDGDDDGNDDV